VPAPVCHHVLRLIPFPGCGHVQVIKLNLRELEVIELCEACGRIATF
jgi:hypothetical protein